MSDSTPKRPKKNQRPSDVLDLGKLDPRALINKRQVLASAYRVSEQTLWRRIKSGQFPQPIPGDGMCFWRVGDVTAWLEAQGERRAA